MIKLLIMYNVFNAKNYFSYEPKNTGSSTLKNHASACKISPTSASYTIDNMLIKTNNVSSEIKRLISDACAKMCSFDIRPYEMVSGRGFELLCQTLIDVGRKITTPTNVSTILPDPTTVSRRVQILADGINDIFLNQFLLSCFIESRKKFISHLSEHLKNVKMIGVTGDYWKNSFTSDSYLTITLHYHLNGSIQTVALKTILVTTSKTGG